MNGSMSIMILANRNVGKWRYFLKGSPSASAGPKWYDVNGISVRHSFLIRLAYIILWRSLDLREDILSSLLIFIP